MTAAKGPPEIVTPDKCSHDTWSDKDARGRELGDGWRCESCGVIRHWYRHARELEKRLLAERSAHAEEVRKLKSEASGHAAPAFDVEALVAGVQPYWAKHGCTVYDAIRAVAREMLKGGVK